MFLNNGCAVVIDTIGGKPITHCTIGNHEYQDYAFDIKATLYVNPLYAIFAKNEGYVWFCANKTRFPIDGDATVMIP